MLYGPESVLGKKVYQGVTEGTPGVGGQKGGRPYEQVRQN